MKKYGLIGYPLGHSFSQNFFNEKFQNEGIEATYTNFEIPSIQSLMAVIEENPQLEGLNVTIPYKEQVIPFLTEVDEEARQIGAVNVIKIVRNKNNTRLIGYNSDVIGFTRSIAPLLKTTHRKALVLGTGGAAKAVAHGLRKLGVEPVFVSRHAQPGVLTYNELTSELLAEHTVVVNCTPVGMYPHVDECPRLPYEAVGPNHLLYDLLYNPDQTLFMRKGSEQGAMVKNGLEMLLLQAFAGWELWNR